MRYGLRCARHYGKNKHSNDPRFRNLGAMGVVKQQTKSTVTMRFQRWLTGSGGSFGSEALSNSDRQKLDLAEKRREKWRTENQTNEAWACFLGDIIEIFKESAVLGPECKKHLQDLASVGRRKSNRKSSTATQ